MIRQKLSFSFLLGLQKFVFKFRERSLQTTHGKIYYLENKNKGKPILVLVHGFSDIPENMMRSCLHLKNNYHIILPALPGFDKRSVKEGDVYSLDKYASQIIEIIDSYGAETFIIGGNSLGGATSTKVYGKVPERVEKLIIMDSAGFEFEGIDTITTKVKAGEPNPFLIDNEMQFDLFFDQLFYKRPKELGPLKKVFVEKYISQKWAYEYLAHQLFMEDHQSQFVLAPSEFKVPTLIVWGEHDQFFPAEVAKKIHDHAKGSQLEIIPRCGHLPHIEKPFALAKILKDFLSS